MINQQMSYKKILLQIFIFAAFLCFSCSQKPVSIIYDKGAVYDKSNKANKEKYHKFEIAENSKTADIKQPAVSEKKATDAGMIEIATGDTLYGISIKYDVTLYDLIKQNDLIPPYNIKVGSKLSIPSPNYHEVKSGDTLYGISRVYNMKMDDLITINDLQEPYTVKLGQRLRVVELGHEKPAKSLTGTNQNQAKIAEPKVEETGSKYSISKPNEDNKEVKIVTKSNGFSWPLQGKIISNFGPKNGGLYNDGINIQANEGDEVRSSEDGVIAYVGNELKGYGNLVIVKHSGGWITAYAHLGKASVTRGQKISKGEKLGIVGSTGNVNSPQLYFGLRKGRDAVNPENYIKV